jgi:Cdc6-like AAA superfamily ATPase
MEYPEQERLRKALRAAFSPGTPIDRYELFAGRLEQVEEVNEAVMLPGRHVILFGERGVGKTSLARVLAEVLALAGIHVMSPKTINCDGTDDFTSLWVKAFREMPLMLTNDSDSGVSTLEGVRTLEDYLPSEESVLPDDVRYVLTRLKQPSIVIFDELDRLQNNDARLLMADTIKNLSDHGVNTTVVLVGVAETVDELLSEHRSIERSLTQVRMPRMTKTELTQILDHGYDQAGMTIEDKAKTLVVHLSQGLPFYTHYLGLHSGLKAVEQKGKTVTVVHVVEATTAVVTKAHNIRSAYLTAISSPQKNLYPEVLLACALAATDELGYFSASDVVEPLSLIMRKESKVQDFIRHLREFTKSARGSVLMQIGGERRIRYRFIDALMQPFVIIDGIAKGRLPIELFLRDSPKERVN